MPGFYPIADVPIATAPYDLGPGFVIIPTEREFRWWLYKKKKQVRRVRHFAPVVATIGPIPFERPSREWLYKKKARIRRVRHFTPTTAAPGPLPFNRWEDRPRPFELVKRRHPRRRQVFAPPLGPIAVHPWDDRPRPFQLVKKKYPRRRKQFPLAPAIMSAVGMAPGHATVSGVGATNEGVGTAAGHAHVHGISGSGSAVQISGVARETLVRVPAVAEISAIVRETLAEPTAIAQVSAVARETLLEFSAQAQVAAIIRETLYASLKSPAVGIAAGHAMATGIAGVTQAVGTAHGQARVQGIAITVVPPAPPQGPTLTQNIIPAYLYVQYNDDDHLQAMVAAYNAYTQAYLDYLNNLNLPIYTTDPVAGLLFDWVGTNLYGYPRPALPQYGKGPIGPLNTWTPNQIVLNGWIPGSETSYQATSDDIYRRCLTWHFYKGDGKQMSIRWLKRRVERFLHGMNGTDTNTAATYDVSVTFPSPAHCTITLPTSSTSKIFQAAIQGGLLETPFQIEFTVDLV